MSAMVQFCCIFPKVVGPSTSGIMTSMRMASGFSRAAMAMPSAPELAVSISQPAVASSERAATSRISSSSSMMRILRMSELILSWRYQHTELLDEIEEVRAGNCDGSRPAGADADGAESRASVRMGVCKLLNSANLLLRRTLDHGEDEFFDLLRLDFGFDEELGWTKTKLGHLLVGDLAAGR